jgi:hypothetical protein
MNSTTTKYTPMIAGISQGRISLWLANGVSRKALIFDISINQTPEIKLLKIVTSHTHKAPLKRMDKRVVS